MKSLNKTQAESLYNSIDPNSWGGAEITGNHGNERVEVVANGVETYVTDTHFTENGTFEGVEYAFTYYFSAEEMAAIVDSDCGALDWDFDHITEIKEFEDYETIYEA